MFSLSGAVRVFVYSGECDMRSSFERLTGLTKNVIKQEPYSGHLFLFLSRNRRSVKILYFDGTGYCIWYKKLEAGTFSKPEREEIDFRTLRCVLEGIEERNIKRKKRYFIGKSEDNVQTLKM